MHLAKEWTFREGTGPEKVFQFGKDYSVDLDKVAGRTGKCYDECVITNQFELKKETKLGFGTGAEWWFEVKLNGEVIYTTFPEGNRHAKISYRNHLFTGTGKAGENRLEIRVRRGRRNWIFCLKEESPEFVDPSSSLTVEADPAATRGKIKPMNAVNNGPIKAMKTQSRGNFEQFRDLEIPFVRNHDASFCSAYGGDHTVDVHMIFPDFSKDPDDPASYDFTLTDRYLKTIMEAGGQVFYRLGSKIEHGLAKYGTKVPADFKKWAVVCEHIIRHYNEGWANGFKMNIEYWEIWNEPDLPAGENGSPTWQGTLEQFFELYRVTALHLKKCFPKLKIGGPAVGRPGDPWMVNFLAAMKQSPRVPLDFFSWHFYGNDPQIYMKLAESIRNILDKAGYRKTESILNEWNYVRNWDTQFVYSVRQIIGLKGAAFNAAVMSSLQNAPVDMLMYYDARPCVFNGLFDYYTYAPLKGYYVFAAWAKLARLGRQFKVDVKAKKGLAATGATDGKGRIGILLSRYFEQDDLPGELPITLKVKEFDLRGAKLYLLDENHDLTEIPCRIDKNGNLLFGMKANTVVYLEAGFSKKKMLTRQETDKLLKLRERIHEILEKRFFSGEDILYDYAGMHGEVVIPTREECLANQPNAFAWNTPIENGGFFNGVLLTGLCDLYEKYPSEKLQRQMQKLYRGLCRLQDSSPVKGCILRGIASDGKSFYPASSNDQVIPFLLGLWRFSQSTASTPEVKADCRLRCRETALALKNNRWIVPGARKGFDRGNIAAKAPCCACHILLAAMILDQTVPTGVSEFERILEERKDAVFSGYPNIPGHACWYSAHNYYILSMVADAYPAYRKQAEKALRITAEAASKCIVHWKLDVPGLAFTSDWHPLNSLWRKQMNTKDAVDITGNEFWKRWTETCPAVWNERNSIMPAFAAAWIVLLSGDKDIIAKTLPDILEALDRVPFENLYYSPFFFAENVIAKII